MGGNFTGGNFPGEIFLEPLMSYRKYLNDKFRINKLTVSKSRLFFISHEGIDVIAESWIFFPEVLSCYSFYIILQYGCL